MTKPKKKAITKRFTVRIPEDLCWKIKSTAADRKVTVNGFAQAALEKAVAA